MDKRHVVDLWRCVATRPKAHRLHARAHRLWDWRHREPTRSWIVYHRLPAVDRAWAEAVANCEGGQYSLNASGHYSWFQWDLQTWGAAGGQGDPRNASFPHQAALAIRWARSGHRSAWAASQHCWG